MAVLKQLRRQLIICSILIYHRTESAEGERVDVDEFPIPTSK